MKKGGRYERKVIKTYENGINTEDYLREIILNYLRAKNSSEVMMYGEKI